MRCASYLCMIYRPICFLTCADREVALADYLFVCIGQPFQSVWGRLLFASVISVTIVLKIAVPIWV